MRYQAADNLREFHQRPIHSAKVVVCPAHFSVGFSLRKIVPHSPSNQTVTLTYSEISFSYWTGRNVHVLDFSRIVQRLMLPGCDACFKKTLSRTRRFFSRRLNWLMFPLIWYLIIYFVLKVPCIRQSHMNSRKPEDQHLGWMLKMLWWKSHCKCQFSHSFSSEYGMSTINNRGGAFYQFIFSRPYSVIL